MTEFLIWAIGTFASTAIIFFLGWKNDGNPGKIPNGGVFPCSFDHDHYFRLWISTPSYKERKSQALAKSSKTVFSEFFKRMVIH